MLTVPACSGATGFVHCFHTSACFYLHRQKHIHSIAYNRGKTTYPYVSCLLLYSFSMLHSKSPLIWQLKAMHTYHLTVSMSQESAQLSWSSALGLTMLQSRCRQAAFSPESVSKEESAARPIQIAGRFITLQQMSEGPGFSWAVGGPQNLEAAFSGPWTSQRPFTIWLFASARPAGRHSSLRKGQVPL